MKPNSMGVLKATLLVYALAPLYLQGQDHLAPESIAGKIYHFGNIPGSALVSCGLSPAFGCIFAYGTNNTFSGFLCEKDQSATVIGAYLVFGEYEYSRTGSNTGTVVHSCTNFPCVPLPFVITNHILLEFDTPVSGTYDSTFPGFPILSPSTGAFKENILIVSISCQETNTYRIEWSGGFPPYVLEKTVSLSHLSTEWSVVETNQETSTIVTNTDRKAFFRVRSGPLESRE